MTFAATRCALGAVEARRPPPGGPLKAGITLHFIDGADLPNNAVSFTRDLYDWRGNRLEDHLAGNGRWGGGAYVMETSAQGLGMNVSSSDAIFGIGFNVWGDSSHSHANTLIAQFVNLFTSQCYATIADDESISIRNGAGGILATSAAGAFKTGWQWFEMRANCSDVGDAEIRIDGVNVVSVTSVDLDNGVGPGCDHLRVRSGSNNTDTDNRFDDIIMWSSDGTITDGTDFFEPCRIETVVPVGDNVVAWTPQGAGDNYVEVDELGTDSDTTYIESSSGGQRDKFDMAELAAAVSSDEMFGLAASVFSRMTNAGSSRVKPIIITEDLTETSGTNAVTTTYRGSQHVSYGNPQTGLLWTHKEVEKAKVAVEFVA